MAEQSEAKMVPTLSLTGVTVNAMALIAPGAFLWITFVVQAGYSPPSGMTMWAGIFAALLLAYATAVSYSELAKLYPGAGSSYLFAEQAFLSKTTRIGSLASQSSRLVGALIFIIGFIRERWSQPSAS
jgi:amino acid transporter